MKTTRTALTVSCLLLALGCDPGGSPPPADPAQAELLSAGGKSDASPGLVGTFVAEEDGASIALLAIRSDGTYYRERPGADGPIAERGTLRWVSFGTRRYALFFAQGKLQLDAYAWELADESGRLTLRRTWTERSFDLLRADWTHCEQASHCALQGLTVTPCAAGEPSSSCTTQQQVWAIEQMYGNEALAGDLIDDLAIPLLRWAEAQILACLPPREVSRAVHAADLSGASTEAGVLAAAQARITRDAPQPTSWICSDDHTCELYCRSPQ